MNTKPSCKIARVLRRIGIRIVVPALIAFATLALPAHAGVVLSTSRATIGVNDEGDLIYQGVGLRYVPTGGEALAPGCACEGWGVADMITRRYGKAGRSFGRQFVSVESFTTDGETARSVVNAAGGLMRVTHEFAESGSENLFRVLVTIENTSTAPIHLRYRRAMDWDVPPTTFSEMVTIVTNGASDVVFSSDNGFADGNPLQAAGSIQFVGEAIDRGPADHGAVFDFDFGQLAVGASKSFVIYYGAARNEEESLNALASVGAEVYSLGKPNPAHAAVEPDGTPNTFIFGFGGVGGRPIIRPLPDYTLGALRIIDNGTGQPVDLQVRIGNAGHKDSIVAPEVAVNFYDGDPQQGGVLLGSQQLAALPPGQFQDVRLNGISGATRGAIHAIVDPSRSIVECRETNNSQQVPFASSSARASISVATDAAVYGSAATAALTGTITNTGFFPYVLTAQLSIEDPNGVVVHTFPAQALGQIEAGASTTTAASWPTHSVLAGDYRLRGVLTQADGAVVASALTAFVVQHDPSSGPAASVRVSTDRPTYSSTDDVALDALVRNLTQATLIRAAQVQLVVSSPQATVMSRTLPVGDLAAGGLRELSTILELRGAVEGTYAATATVLDAEGHALATASTSFVVDEDLRSTLRGSVEVGVPELDVGEVQLCTSTVTNHGTLALAAQPLRHLVVKLSDEALVVEQSYSASLNPGSSHVDVRGVATAGYDAADYACVLQAQVDGAWITLGHAAFRVNEPPIRIESALALGERGRVLILVDAATSETDAADPFSPADVPDLNTQRSHLRDVLDAKGWSYTIVSTAMDFEREFNTGGYEVYAIFSEAVHLSVALQDRVVAAVHAGAGLLVAGNHDRRNSKLEAALGVRSLGRNLDVSALIVGDSPIMDAAEEQITLDPYALEMRLEGATSFARYRVANAQPNQETAAATTFAYGEGRSVYVSLDLLLAGAASGDDSLFAEVLTSALAHVHPAAIAPRAGSVIPLRVTLTNEGVATPGRVVLGLPAGVTVVDSNGAEIQPDGALAWQYALSVAETLELTLWVSLPAQPGDIQFSVVIQTGVAPDYEDHDEQILTVRVAPRL